MKLTTQKVDSRVPMPSLLKKICMHFRISICTESHAKQLQKFSIAITIALCDWWLVTKHMLLVILRANVVLQNMGVVLRDAYNNEWYLVYLRFWVTFLKPLLRDRVLNRPSYDISGCTVKKIWTSAKISKSLSMQCNTYSSSPTHL